MPVILYSQVPVYSPHIMHNRSVSPVAQFVNFKDSMGRIGKGHLQGSWVIKMEKILLALLGGLKSCPEDAEIEKRSRDFPVDFAQINFSEKEKRGVIKIAICVYGGTLALRI